MTDIRLELDRWTFGVPLLFSIGLLVFILISRVFWLGQTMAFPIYYYFLAIFFFSLVTTIVFEVLYAANEMGALVIFVGALLIIPELPLPGEFNFLMAILGVAMSGNLIIGLLKTF